MTSGLTPPLRDLAGQVAGLGPGRGEPLSGRQGRGRLEAPWIPLVQMCRDQRRRNNPVHRDTQDERHGIPQQWITGCGRQ